MPATLCPQAVDYAKMSKLVLDTVEKMVGGTSVSRRNFHLLFQDVYSICTARPQPYIDELHETMTSYFNEHLAAVRDAILARQSDLVAKYHDAFTTFHRGAEAVGKAFKFLDTELQREDQGVTEYETGRQFPLSRPEQAGRRLTVFSLAMATWNQVVFTPLKDRLVHDVLQEITRDRDGEPAQLSTVQGVLESMVKMCSYETQPAAVYVSEFEEPFLAATEAYYARESSQYLSEYDSSSYMVKAEARLEEELMRGQKTVQALSREKLKRICLKKMAADHKAVLEVECVPFIQRQQFSDLARMYRLLRQVENGLDCMLDMFEKHVRAEGLQKLKSLEASNTLSPETYFEAMTTLHEHFTDVIKQACSLDPPFVAALDKACRHVMNVKLGTDSSSRSPELLAKFCDSCLRKSSKNASEAVVEEKLAQLVTIFQYIDAKDAFQKFYSKMLAKRLIHGSSLSDEAEEGMISRLKVLCGYDYTSKLQRMFTDVTLSAGLNSRFQESSFSDNLGFNVRLLVLQAGAWPLGTSSSSDCHLPADLQHCISSFEAFYKQQHKNRKLTWMHHLATADLKGHFGSRNYDFVVTAYQMNVLLMFNEQAERTAREIQAQTALSQKELDRTLRSLATCNLLQVAGNGTLAKEGPVDPETLLVVNQRYSNKRKKVKVSAAVQRETPTETLRTLQTIKDDRKLHLQAVTVRIMKMRKSMTYASLIQEVIDQCQARFKPSVPHIKKCIEELIDKGYMERQEDDKGKLFYIA